MPCSFSLSLSLGSFGIHRDLHIDGEGLVLGRSRMPGVFCSSAFFGGVRRGSQVVVSDKVSGGLELCCTLWTQRVARITVCG